MKRLMKNRLFFALYLYMAVIAIEAAEKESTITLVGSDGAVVIEKRYLQYLPGLQEMINTLAGVEGKEIHEIPVPLISKQMLYDLKRYAEKLTERGPHYRGSYTPFQIQNEVSAILSYASDEKIVNFLLAADYLGEIALVNATVRELVVRIDVFGREPIDCFAKAKKKFGKRMPDELSTYFTHWCQLLRGGTGNDFWIADLIAEGRLPIVKEGDLVLSSRRLTGLEGLEFIDHPDKVITLDLSGNWITSVPADLLKGFSNLEKVNFRCNQLVTIPAELFKGLKNLKFIYFDGNKLAMLPEGVFQEPSIESINLSANQLVTLPTKLFQGLNMLKELNLGHNNLSGLPAEIFKGLVMLKELNLGYNHLSGLSAEIFKGLTSLQGLKINENPLSEQEINAIKAALPNVEVLAWRRLIRQ
jgi:hypothetical protein